MTSGGPSQVVPGAKSVLFHVGLPKAASSFLQRHVFPGFSDATFLHPASREISRYPKAFNSSSAFLAEFETARQAILEAKHAKVIVSAEGFVGDSYHSFRDHEAKAAGLKALWPDAAVLLVIRRQDRFCQSLFGQALRKGFPYDPARFLMLENDGAPAELIARRFDYRAADLDRLVRTYENLFGEPRVFVVPLELLVENSAAFVGAVQSIDNYQLAASPGAKVENKSYSTRGYRAARLLNRFCLDELDSGARFFAWLDRKAGEGALGWRACRFALRSANRFLKRRVRRCVERINKGGGEAARPLTDGQLTRIREHFAPSNRALSTRRSLGLERYGYF